MFTLTQIIFNMKQKIKDYCAVADACNISQQKNNLKRTKNMPGQKQWAVTSIAIKSH